MTYEESYMKCKSKEEILEEVKNDIAIAEMINPDRVHVIKLAVEKVVNAKFGKEDK